MSGYKAMGASRTLKRTTNKHAMIEKVVTIKSLREDSSASHDDYLYWMTKTVSERIAAVELLRADYMRGLPDVDQRLQRVCTITQHQRG